MNTGELSFDIQLDPVETEYTSPSLEATMDEIRVRLDIVEIAEALGIQLRKVEEGEFTEYTEGEKDVYVGNCLRCNNEGCLFLSRRLQTFGCGECHWESLYEQHMDIYWFLTHSLQNEFPYGESLGYDASKRKIQKLYSLFPKALDFLVKKDPHTYIYNANYFTLAKEYYPGIENELKRLEQERQSIIDDRRERRSSREWEYHYDSRHEDNIKKQERLRWIIKSDDIVSKIYARAREVDTLLVHTVTPGEIGLGIDSWVEPVDMTEIPDDFFPLAVDDSLEPPANTLVGVYFQQKEGESLGLDNDDFFDPVIISEHYLEIPDATFHSDVPIKLLTKTSRNPWIEPERMSLPVVGKYVIAYSLTENNFSFFFSEGDERRLHEAYSTQLGYSRNIWIPETTIESISQGVGSPYRSDKTDIPLSSGYRSVAEGGWVKTDVGMYLSSFKGETGFDANLFHACAQELEETVSSMSKDPLDIANIYTDIKKFTKDFENESHRRRQIEIDRERRYHERHFRRFGR